MKTYKLRVDDYIIYEKNYIVEANSVKEAREKFKRGEWIDSEGENDSTFYKSIIKKVTQRIYKDTFLEFLASKGWEMRKGKKYRPNVLYKNVAGFSHSLFWFCTEDKAEQFISKPSGAELWGTFNYDDGLSSLKVDKVLKV